MTNRRQFLSGCSTLALAAAFSPAALSAAPIVNQDAGVDQLSYTTLSQCQGSEFIVRPASAPAVALELTRASLHQPSYPGAATAPDAGHRKFSLLFHGPKSAPLTQDTYTFEHSRIGRFEMFIVPVGAQKETHSHIHYEAVFNRPAGRFVAA